MKTTFMFPLLGAFRRKADETFPDNRASLQKRTLCRSRSYGAIKKGATSV